MSEVKCSCQHCNGHIAFPAEMAGQMFACPHCGLETKLSAPTNPLTRPPNNVSVEIKRGVSPLGIASLVLGIIACVFCWIPLLGLLAVPLALIGLLLALVGIILAGVNKKTGFVFPISGATVCLLSIFVAFAITGGLAAAFSKGQFSGIQEWSKSMSVKQGEINVTVQRVHIGEVVINDALGQPQITAENFLTINLTVANLEPNKKIDFQSWNGTANLSDNNGNSYKRINVNPNIDITPNMNDGTAGRMKLDGVPVISITPNMEGGSANANPVSIYPLKKQLDAIVFEPPVENTQWLHLELPADNFGGSGMLRFEIPMGKILAARAAIRKLADDYESSLPKDRRRIDPKIEQAYGNNLQLARSRIANAETNLEAAP